MVSGDDYAKEYETLKKLRLDLERGTLNLDSFNYSCCELPESGWGKCVQTYDWETNTIGFEVSHTQEKIWEFPPKKLESNMVIPAFDSVSIKDINTVIGKHQNIFSNQQIGIGGGFYVMLNPEEIFAFRDSGDFGPMLLGLAQKCFEDAEYNFIPHKEHFKDEYWNLYMARSIQINRRGTKSS